MNIDRLAKGDYIDTEYGIVRVHATSWGQIQVESHDGRKLWAEVVAPVPVSPDTVAMLGHTANGGEVCINGVSFSECEGGGLAYRDKVNGRMLSRPFTELHELQAFVLLLTGRPMAINGAKPAKVVEPQRNGFAFWCIQKTLSGELDTEKSMDRLFEQFRQEVRKK